MESIFKGSSIFKFSKTSSVFIFDAISYLFVLLFVYTAISKIMSIDTLQKVLGHYPLLSKYTVTTSYAVPIVEILTALLLIITRTKQVGMFASLILMSAFLSYILYMIWSRGTNLPCSCGGIISQLSWKDHIWFNSILILIAGFALCVHKTT